MHLAKLGVKHPARELTSQAEHPVRPVVLHFAQGAVLTLGHTRRRLIPDHGDAGNSAPLDVGRQPAGQLSVEGQIERPELAAGATVNPGVTRRSGTPDQAEGAAEWPVMVAPTRRDPVRGEPGAAAVGPGARVGNGEADGARQFRLHRQPPPNASSKATTAPSILSSLPMRGRSAARPASARTAVLKFPRSHGAPVSSLRPRSSPKSAMSSACARACPSSAPPAQTSPPPRPKTPTRFSLRPPPRPTPLPSGEAHPPRPAERIR